MCNDVGVAYPDQARGETYAADEFDAALKGLATDLREDLSESVERGMAQLHEEVADCFATPNDPDSEALITDTYAAVLDHIFDGLESSWHLPERDPPELACEDTRVSADRGVGLSVLAQSYRIVHRLISEEAIEKAAGRVTNQDLGRAVLGVTNHSMFADFDWMVARLIETYEHERLLLARDEEWFRRRLVRNLLQEPGGAIDAGSLNYDFAGPHISLVAWGSDAQRVPAAIQGRAGLPLLSVAGTPTTTWAWLGVSDLDRDGAAVREALEDNPGARLAVGEPATGIEGFRLSHRQAWGAYRIARDTEADLTWYADVALLVLTLQDQDAARQFVLNELGPFASDEPRSKLLRETLSVYFRCGHNGAAAAAALGIHDRTVLYRIRTIEEGLGRSVTARREELALALRLAPVLLQRRDRPVAALHE